MTEESLTGAPLSDARLVVAYHMLLQAIDGHKRIYYTDKNSLIFQGYVVDRCPTLRQ